LTRFRSAAAFQLSQTLRTKFRSHFHQRKAQSLTKHLMFTLMEMRAEFGPKHPDFPTDFITGWVLGRSSGFFWSSFVARRASGRDLVRRVSSAPTTHPVPDERATEKPPQPGNAQLQQPHKRYGACSHLNWKDTARSLTLGASHVSSSEVFNPPAEGVVKMKIW